VKNASTRLEQIGLRAQVEQLKTVPLERSADEAEGIRASRPAERRELAIRAVAKRTPDRIPAQPGTLKRIRALPGGNSRSDRSERRMRRPVDDKNLSRGRPRPTEEPKDQGGGSLDPAPPRRRRSTTSASQGSAQPRNRGFQSARVHDGGGTSAGSARRSQPGIVRAAKKAGLKVVTTHDLRRTFISHLIAGLGLDRSASHASPVTPRCRHAQHLRRPVRQGDAPILSRDGRSRSLVHTLDIILGQRLESRVRAL
jgi:integrase